MLSMPLIYVLYMPPMLLVHYAPYVWSYVLCPLFSMPLIYGPMFSALVIDRALKILSFFCSIALLIFEYAPRMRAAAASCASWAVCYVDVWDPESAEGRGINISQCRVFEYARGHTQQS